MNTESSLESARRALSALRESVTALQVTVEQDQPASGSSVLVDQLDNRILELAALLEEVELQLNQAACCHSTFEASDEARSILCILHRSSNQAVAMLASEIGSFDAIARLLRMGRERGREWREWSEVVKAAIDQCQAPAKRLSGCLVNCWSDFAATAQRQQVTVKSMPFRDPPIPLEIAG